ncbi:glutamine cyclotransferase [Mucilaginibacter yixingensis]|uniref:Glutamine cyclotransferase n=1 Tax=Mucilaginibacter yixingensis TaxID=1295612 RepID=A0A2T5JER9_9SPHI|nr:glutaminyl-peptide cyclotransferase [Mucilaginibacter yixingensis]PTR00923.1 glutamine cyclotransferase [Mucilaginibacter yixingensis]
MKTLKVLALGGALLLAFGCSHKDNKTAMTLSPEMGTTYKTGDAIPVKLQYPSDVKPDSVVYLLDSVRFASTKDSAGIKLKTDTMRLGSRLITAKLYQGGKAEEVSTNFMLYPSKAPEELAYKVDKVFPHDTSSYTEGLLYQDGFLYESDGGREGEDAGRSSLRKVNVETGKPVLKVDGDPKVFSEGISIVGDKLIQLTYTEKLGYVYDKNTFKLLKTFTNNVGYEGWGMCYDGHKLYMDDSTNRVWFLNPETYAATGFIDVYDDKGPVNQINELEMIDGKLWANIYQTDTIIVIDPKTGAVLQSIDLSKLYPQAQRAPNADVLNGIAWDPQGKRLFITGKKWPKLYQISVAKK